MTHPPKSKLFQPRVQDGVKVGRRRLLRLMRENHLLSPYRGRRGNPRLHEGEIITPAPNLHLIPVLT